MIVYVETNFVLEIACEQQQVVSANEILNENGRPSGFDIYSAFRSYIFTSSSQPSPCAPSHARPWADSASVCHRHSWPRRVLD